VEALWTVKAGRLIALLLVMREFDSGKVRPYRTNTSKWPIDTVTFHRTLGTTVFHV